MISTRTPVLRRRTLLAAASALSAALAGAALPALAYDVNATAAINVDGDSVILRGVDPTSYAAGKTPQAGAADHTAVSDGAIYRFASTDAQDRFVASPSTYKPAFGGFCATGAALGKKLDGDPKIFRILDGQLYVFVHQQAVEIWDKDPAGTLAKANANWPQIKDRTPASL
jgi:hypothetical protein